jgi:hypothetical protein
MPLRIDEECTFQLGFRENQIYPLSYCSFASSI